MSFEQDKHDCLGDSASSKRACWRRPRHNIGVKYKAAQQPATGLAPVETDWASVHIDLHILRR
jgi:hypothetical protein